MNEALLQDRTQKRIERTHAYLLEQNGSHAVETAQLAHQILDEIIVYIRPGIRESEVKAYTLECFEKHDIEDTWHPPYVRFGEHTLLTFMDTADADLILSEDDIAFVDIGIVKNGIEGDAGRTVTFGSHDELPLLAQASQAIFQKAIDFWQAHNPTGIELYQHIYQLAEEMNVRWNLDPAGHLIGAYPHKGWKRGINHYPDKVESGKWILEIQVKHKALPYGAFFEDLLYPK